MNVSLISALLLSTLALTPTRAEDGQGTAPAIILNLERRDLMLHRNEDQRIEIPFVLPGQIPFVVTSVQRSCSCVSIEAPDSPIASGTPQHLRLNMNAGSLLGTTEAYVQILGTIGGAPRSISLLVRGSVRDYVEWPPGSIIDLGIHAQEDLPKDLHIQVRRGTHPQHVDTVVASILGGDGIASVTTTVVGPDVMDIGIRLEAKKVCGRLTGEIDLACADGPLPLPYHPRHPFAMTIQGALQAHPGGILFGAVPAGICRSKTVMLEGAALALGATASDAAHVACTMSGDAGHQAIQAAFTGAGPARNASGSIDVALKGGGILRIPYFASVLPAAGQPVAGNHE